MPKQKAVTAKVPRKKVAGKKKVNSTKTVIDGIEFKSGLEGTMYNLLKVAGIPCTYEGKQYVTMADSDYPAECFERVTRKSKAMVDRRKITGVKYTPDFLDPNEEWFIETKGRANESFSIRWKLFKHLFKGAAKPPMIFKPSTTKDCEQVVQILISKGYGR